MAAESTTATATYWNYPASYRLLTAPFPETPQVSAVASTTMTSTGQQLHWPIRSRPTIPQYRLTRHLRHRDGQLLLDAEHRPAPRSAAVPPTISRASIRSRHAGQLWRADADDSAVARQPGHRCRQQRPESMGQATHWTTDQRGYARIVNGTVDMGAYEYSSSPLVSSPLVSPRPRTWSIPTTA